jgi:hypothetical protein
VLFVTTVHRALWGALKTHPQHSSGQLWSWNIQATNMATCSYPFVQVIVELLLLHGITCYVILVDVMETKIGVVSSWGRKRNAYDKREWRSPTDCMNTSQWRCHNCSCGMRAVKKLMRYYTKVGTISTGVLEVLHDKQLHYYSSGSHLFPDVCHIAYDYDINILRMSSFYINSLDRRSIF